MALKFSTGPSSWKRAHITPLLKVDVPKRKRDYRRINITPVIAYTIEKCRYITSTSTVEQHLSLTQFATRTGRAIQIHAWVCSTLPTVISTILRYHEAVQLFAMDFRKVFDSVNHECLSIKRKLIPLNPFIINWYLSFPEKRQQGMIYNSFRGQCAIDSDLKVIQNS